MNNINWQDNALCIGKDTNWFFPEMGVKGSAEQARNVKNFCKACSVRQECLNTAIENDEQFGIWGGLTPKERNNLKNRLRINAVDSPISLVTKHDSNKIQN